MAAAIAFLHERRAEMGRTGPFAVGGFAMPMYVGTPEWDLGEHSISGSPDQLAERVREAAAVGSTHLQVRLRSRGADELVDQIEAFGSEVIPLTN
jgi:hypothetical protein